MRSILGLLFLGVTACTPGKKTTIENPRLSPGIVGGDFVSEKSDLNKSIVGVYDGMTGFLCSGSLLERNVVLTAAHCIKSDTSNLHVVFAADILAILKNPTPVIIAEKFHKVSSSSIHPDWNANVPDTQEFGWSDIALVKFAGEIPEGYVPATLLNDARELKLGAKVVIAGYGVDKVEKTEVDPSTIPDLEDAIAREEVGCTPDRKRCFKVEMSGSGILRSGEVTITKIESIELALDQRKSQGACAGDSGGPAYIFKNNRYLLFGLSSHGNSIGCDQDAIYTNLLKFSDWISRTIPSLN